MIRRTISIPVFVISVLGVAAAASGFHFVRQWQLSRLSQTLLVRARSEEGKQNWLAAAEQLDRYLRLAPHNQTVRAQLARVFAKGAKAQGFKIIIAGAGGAAHLPGVTAALTPLPVFGVPIESKALSGVDSLYSIVQMPPGIPVGTLAIGRRGAVTAALLAASVLALSDKALADRLDAWRQRQAEAVPEVPTD